MKRSRIVFLGIGSALLVTLLGIPQTTQAGPPLICHPLDIGGLKISAEIFYHLVRLHNVRSNLAAPLYFLAVATQFIDARSLLLFLAFIELGL